MADATKTAPNDAVRRPDERSSGEPPPSPPLKSLRERVDATLRFDDDPFVVDWAPPSS